MMKVTLPVLNLEKATYECTYGRGCDGICCMEGRPIVYKDEIARLDANLEKFMPLLPRGPEGDPQKGRHRGIPGVSANGSCKGGLMVRVLQQWLCAAQGRRRGRRQVSLQARRVLAVPHSDRSRRQLVRASKGLQERKMESFLPRSRQHPQAPPTPCTRNWPSPSTSRMTTRRPWHAAKMSPRVKLEFRL